MKTRNKLNILQRSRRLLWYFTVALLVVAAISMTLARELISNVGDWRTQLELIASDYLEQPLRIETFDAKIIGFTPTFIFKNVSLLEKSSEKILVRFKEAQVGISIINSIKNQKLTPKSFVISGINLVVTQNKNNTFKINGIDVPEFDPSKNIDFENSNELSNWLFHQDKLKLENSTIHWYNPITKKVLKFSNINLNLNSSGNRHTLSGDWQLQSQLAKRFKIELDMVGNLLNPASWEGAAYVKGEEVNITKFGIPSNIIPLKPTSGVYNFEIWANFKLGQLKEIAGATTVRNLKFNPSKLNKAINIDKIGAVWRWDNLADGWALNIDRFYHEANNKIWPLSRLLVESHSRFQPNSIIDIYVDKLDIEDASQFIQKLNIVGQDEITRLQKIDPHGRIFDTHVRFKADEFLSDDFIFQTEFTNITTKPDSYIPGIGNFTGIISTTNKSGSMIFNSKNSNVDFSKFFRDKIIITNLDGRLNWRKVNKEWYLSGENVNLSNNDIETNSSLFLIFPEKKKSPLIDLQINFKSGDVANAGKYFPVSIMDQDLIEWLDSSLVSGSVKKGGVVLHGRLDDFPYLNYNGKFKVSFESDDFVLQYLENWPKIVEASAEINFTGSGFDINISKAKIFNSTVKETKVHVDDFTAPELVIKSDIDSSTNDIFKYLINSSIARDSSSVIEKFKISGESKVNIQINVPLSDEMEKTHSLYYKGSIVTKESTISLYNDIFVFDHINGKLNFSKKGFSTDDLTAICFKEPAKIDIYSQSKDNSLSHHVLVQGKYDSASIQKKFNIPWMEKSSGTSKWQGIFNFGYSTDDTEIPASIVVTTDLQGINLNLPSPLYKAKEYKLPISIESKFISKYNNKINISIDDDISISSIINYSSEKFHLKSANINFGVVNNTKLQDEIILVQGDIHDFNFGSWVNFIDDFKGNRNNNFISPDLGVVFDVNSYLISDLKDKRAPSELDEITKDDKQSNKTTKKSAVDPRKIPEFRGEIRNISYEESKVGTIKFNFRHSKNGFDIKKLNLHSANFDFNSSGIWYIFPDKNKDQYITKFTNAKFISSDLGATLSSLGFKSVLNKGISNSDLSFWWYDSPFDFSIDKLSGEMFINVTNGEILEIDPKAGRLLGLLSLSNLPRRLFGDFSDVFSSGLQFDSIQGKVRIANGVMSSKNILMTSSPAKIKIYGETDLVNRNFNQKIKVTPNLTDTTAILGGLLYGLPTLIATKILGGIIDFDEAKMKTYHVTGTWEKPVITTLSEPEINLDNNSELESTSDDNGEEN